MGPRSGGGPGPSDPGVRHPSSGLICEEDHAVFEGKGERMKDLRAPTDGKFKINRFDPNDTSAFDGKKEEAEQRLAGLRQELDGLQELFYADHRHALLMVLQGMDTAGKDGTIRHVFDGVNPQGVHVASFKVPTPAELDHDFLWRIHAKTPAKGHITIFNRSHYEDVLAVRVHNLVPQEEWEERFRAISEFERELVHEGTTILKFFLHIDKEEQKARLQARLDDPSKHWKFSEADLHERQYWPQYQVAYEDLISRTSSSWAPWYVIPSNHKWFRNWAVSKVLIDTLKGMKLEYPKSAVDLASVHIT